ncbi:MAG: hypothetical protein WDN48_05850 [Pseudolabrys sp.]
MTAATTLTMADGAGIDLDAVTAADIHAPSIIEQVCKEARYNGATTGLIYFVGQHLVLGTEAMLRDGATELEAGCFVVHDWPEGFFKDDPTPKKRTIARRIESKCGVTADAFRKVLKEIDDEHEAAVHEAVGLPWPIPEDVKRIVKLYDIKMFVTEWRDLMGNRPHPDWSPYEGVDPLPETIVPWPWEECRDRLTALAYRLLPKLRLGERE